MALAKAKGFRWRESAKKVTNKKLISCSIFAVYGIVFNFYCWWLSEYFAFLPEYRLYPAVPEALALAFVFYGIASWFVPLRLERPSDGILLFLFFYAYTPMTFVKIYTQVDVFISMIVDFIAMICYIGLCILSSRNVVGLRIPEVSRNIFIIGLLLFAFFLIGSFFVEFGFTVRTLSLLDVYGARGEFAGEAESASTVAIYALTWFAFVVGPLLFLAGVYWVSRGYYGGGVSMLLTGIIGQVYIFTSTGLKSSVLFLLITGLLYWAEWAYSSARLAFLCLISFLLFYIVYLFAMDFPFAHLNRRLLFVSGLNSAYYFDYYSKSQPLYWGYTSWGRLLGATAADPPGRTIGRNYYNDYQTNATTGVWADAYANLGIVGIPIISCVLLGLLSLLNAAASGIPKRVVIPLTAVISYPIAYSGMSTVLSTYGFILLLILLYFFPLSMREPIRRSCS